MVGTTVSHYTILEKLGEGGMGVVYPVESRFKQISLGSVVGDNDRLSLYIIYATAPRI